MQIKKVLKRDKRTKDFDFERVMEAIHKAYIEVDGTSHTFYNQYDLLKNTIQKELDKENSEEIEIEKIQDIVILSLKEIGQLQVAESYEDYREKRSIARQSSIYNDFMSIVDTVSNDITKDNANMNADTPAGMMMKFASETTKRFSNDKLIPKKANKAMKDNFIYIHDKDYYPTKSLTCLQHPLDRLLSNGFRAGHGSSRPTKRIETSSIIGCISMEQIQNEMHGGQAIPAFDFYNAPSVRMSYIEEINKLSEYDGKDYSYLHKIGIEDYIKRSLDGLVEEERVVQQAINKTVNRVHQAMEGFIHNMNTIHSRGGNQVVFSSLNYGTDTSPEGRCVIREILQATYEGVGNGETPIFPIQIWKKKRGVNYLPTDRNYDLYQFACKVTAKRFFPNFINLDATFNQSPNWKAEDPQRYLWECATMGCVDGHEIITYKINNKLYVESFERMWNRLADIFTVKEQETKDNYYIDLKNVSIFDTKNGFVDTKRIIKNKDKGDWTRIKFSNGRSLLATSDHPLPIINKGRTFVKDLQINDKISINQSQYTEESITYNKDKAWLLGFILCDGCYDDQISSSIALTGEDDIETNYKRIFKEFYNLDVKTVVWNRGERGNYKELKIGTEKYEDYKKVQLELLKTFGGKQKIYRQIPNEVFSWNKEAKLSFLAGMIDADGYINSTGHCGSTIQIGSTNKELALQTMALSQSLGLPTKLYLNHYTSKNKNKIRYRVEFSATIELLSYMACHKKIDCFTREANITQTNEASVTSIEFLGDINNYSYDVTTESDHFEVSGIYSHNCRTRVFEDMFGDSTSVGRGNLSFSTLNLVKMGIESKLKYPEDLNKRIKYFYKLLDKYSDIVAEQLYERFKFQSTAKAKQFPLLMSGMWNGSDKLKPNDTIGEVIKTGTLGVGFIGLAECLIMLTGYHHGENKESQKLGIEIISHLRDTVDGYKQQYNLNYSVLATPAEGLSGNFTKLDKKKYGDIPNVTNKAFYTNSNHIPVWYKCSIAHKAEVEAPYHELTRAGHIFYVELDGDATHNPKSIEKVVDLMDKNNMGYGSVNHTRTRCLDCGFENADSELKECPKCKSNNISVIQRITGYLVGTLDSWNSAKKDEFKHRVTHGIEKIEE